MRTFLNFTIAILLLIAFVGSGAFFVIVSKDLKLERASTSTSSNASPTTESTSDE
ncbi:hypothetical protein [Roseibacillus persicicus]|uniref:hypothetical protein n=1 Tax=Roseibacillus persicicus TaxID=454148 RepID=UPI0016723B06|nr:hypothetical protein [Roseibacillus persicicus]MDQ8192269.1 hypothetical protein [Roseibacillus persicicus]